MEGIFNIGDFYKCKNTEIKVIKKAIQGYKIAYINILKDNKEYLYKTAYMYVKKINKYSRIKYKGTIAAGLAVVILLCISNPAIASNIPFIGDIYRYLNRDTEKIYENYYENSTVINSSVEQNGVKITIKEAIFDGIILDLTYEVESEKISDSNFYLGVRSIAEVTNSNGEALEPISSSQQKLDEKTYLGQGTFKVNELSDKIAFNINWIDILILDEGGNSISKNITADNEVFIDGDIKEIIEGKWSFNIELNAIESEIVKSDQVVSNERYKFSIDNILLSTISSNIDFSYTINKISKDQWKFKWAELEIGDDLGNSYQVQGFGTSSDGTECWSSAIFEKVDEGASKIIIVPKITEGQYNAETNDFNYRDVKLDSIVIDIK